MKKIFKGIVGLFGIFFIPPLSKLIQRQLEQSERDLLRAENEFDHASATVSMYEERCVRLRIKLDKLQEAERNSAHDSAHTR